MAKFSAKRKGTQSFAPRFVYPPKVQIKQMRGKLLPTSKDPAGDLARDLANLIARGIKRQNKLSSAERPCAARIL